MEIPDHLTCLLRNLYAGKEAMLRTRHGTANWIKIGNVYVKAVDCHPAYLTFMQSTLSEMPDWMKYKLESRLPGEISTTSEMQMTPPHGRKWRGTKELDEELKSFLDESERGEWKSWLKTQHSVNENQVIQSHHFMANRWGNNGNSDCLFSWAPKSLQMVTSVLKLKRRMLLGRKAMTNLDSMLKSRDIILPTKFCLVKKMFFPVSCMDVRVGP